MHRQIRPEQIRLLYANRVNVLSGSLAIGVLPTIVLWQNSNKIILSLWCMTAIALVIVRWKLSSEYGRRTTVEQNEHCEHWAKQFAAGSFLQGVLWGAVPLIFYTDNVHLFALILTLHAGFVACAALATSIYLPILLAFVIPSSILFFIATLLKGGLEYWPHALIIVAYSIVLLLYAKRNSQSVLEQVSLRLENAELMENLKTEKEKAEQAMLAKNRFLAAASHDLRQPVHALGLFVSSMETRDDVTHRRYVLEKIKQATSALAGLFHGLLDISKLDANVLKNNPDHVCLDSLLLLIESQFQHSAQEKGLEFKVPTTTEHIAYVDEGLLERILRNLVSNAIKYTHAGYVTVIVEIDEDDTLSIAVEDSGTGIDECEHKNIFSEYHQLINPARDREQGLGLGLAIVQRLCKLTEIPISVESKLGLGSTFTLKVPRGDPNQVMKTPTLENSKEYFPLNVLVIDDEKEIVEGMRQVLKSWHCNTITATSIDSALQALKGSHAPDVIIADFRLGESISGLDAIKIIREEFNLNIPALLITGDTAPERLQQAATAEITVLHKPVEPTLLKQALDRFSLELV